MIEQNIIIDDLSNDDYHADLALSSSNLKDLLISPYHYWHNKHKAHKQSPALIFGTLLHTLFLEPHMLKKEFFIADKPKRNSKVGKEAYNELDLERGKRHWITVDDFSQAKNMIDSLHSNPLIKAMLKQSQVEQSLFFKDPVTGINCKVRADVISIDQGFIIDLKTTAMAANEKDFRYTLRKYSYALSAAFYADGFGQVLDKNFDFIWVVVEKSEPYSHGIYQVSPEMHEIGRKAYREALGVYQKAKATNGFTKPHNDGKIYSLAV